MFRTLLAGVACLLVCVTAAAATPQLEAYGSLPAVDNVSISPDGGHIAMVAGPSESRRIIIVDLKQGAIVASTTLGKAKVRSLGWAGPNYLVVVTSQTTYSPYFGDDKHEISTAMVRDLKRARWTVMLDKRKDALPMVLGAPLARIIAGHPFLFFASYNFPVRMSMVHSLAPPDPVAPALYRVDLDKDDTEIVVHGGDNTLDWILDTLGEPVARTDYNEREKSWALWVNSGGRWIESQRLVTPFSHPSVEAFTADGRSLLVRDFGADDVAAWHAVSLTTGVWSGELADYRGASSVIIDPMSFHAIGRTIPDRDGDGYRYEFASELDRQLWALIVRSFPGEAVRREDWTDDRSQIVVRVEGDKHGDAYFVVDTKTLKATLVSDVYEGIHPADHNPVRRIDYKAQDGLDIPAYLTLPLGLDPKALPLVVLVHGGPIGRDSLEFDWWSQAIASRGYAVLQPQFRGSDGFGEKLLTAGYGEWGGKMQTDVSDGVRELVKQGVVDPARVCIAGASYGGYAALAGATLDPDPYRCVVSVSGISDVRRMLDDDVDNQVHEENRFQRSDMQLLGVKSMNEPRVRAVSPLFHTDRVKAPVLLIHGLDDTIVKYEQSQLMADALRRAGKPVEFVTLKSEDHWLSRGETRIQMLQAMMKFVEAKNPPDPPKADAGQSAAR